MPMPLVTGSVRTTRSCRVSRSGQPCAWLAALAAWAAVLPAWAAPATQGEAPVTAEPARPRLGLVLSGG
ncbi:MAG: hypothetical protein ACRC6L_15040, partial [Steroidobacteraceae bacterium]